MLRLLNMHAGLNSMQSLKKSFVTTASLQSLRRKGGREGGMKGGMEKGGEEGRDGRRWLSFSDANISRHAVESKLNLRPCDGLGPIARAIVPGSCQQQAKEKILHGISFENWSMRKLHTCQFSSLRSEKWKFSHFKKIYELPRLPSLQHDEGQKCIDVALRFSASSIRRFNCPHVAFLTYSKAHASSLYNGLALKNTWSHPCLQNMFQRRDLTWQSEDHDSTQDIDNHIQSEHIMSSYAIAILSVSYKSISIKRIKRTKGHYYEQGNKKKTLMVQGTSTRKWIPGSSLSTSIPL